MILDRLIIQKCLRRLLNPCYKELQKRLTNYLNQDLSCTGHPRPVTLLLDKGTIKHNTSQLTLIRTLCLKGGVLLESFLIGNPNVLDNSGISLTKLLIDTVTETFGREEDLRECLSGVCVDGQYIHLKLGTHLSNILQIPQNIMDDSVIWDAAHRLELSAKYAKV